MSPPPSAPTSPAPGAEPRYQVLHRLASGGMADVYLAVQRGPHGFEKHTILKRMRAELVDHEDYRRMFIDEARLMASLSHANVVSVLDFGESPEGIYLALEYVEGLDLRRLLKRRRRLAPAFAIYLGSCVLHALGYVHARRTSDGQPLGVVHRDISPANIFLGRNGDVKLGDFGIAKSSRAATHTEPGTLKGKLAYMSPEQAMAEKVDGRSDLFAVGVVLFELLTGVRPFTGKSDFELLRTLIQDEAPAAQTLAPSLSPALCDFLRRALAKERAARFQSADEMWRALSACGDGALAGPADVAREVAEALGSETAPAPSDADPFAAALGLERVEGSTVREGRPETMVLQPPRSWRAPAAFVGLALLGSGGLWLATRGEGQPSASVPVPPTKSVAAAPPPKEEPAPPPRPAAEQDAAAVAAPPPAPMPPKDASPSPPLAKQRPAPPGARGRATLDVNSTPWARVFLDGAFVGETPLTGLVVTSGRHRLRLVNPARQKSWETTLELAPGERRVLPVDLEPEAGAGAP